MTGTGPRPISIDAAISGLTFLPDRTPTTSDADAAGAFSQLSEYRDGGIFVGHWAGSSEWERHAVGDEIVIVLAGETVITFLDDGLERSSQLGRGEMVVVPQGVWHRFETAREVTVMSVTPQPTDHQPTDHHPTQPG